MTTIPSGEELLSYFTTLSNWGRWGPDDEIGTLNLITPQKRRAAASSVQEGVVVSCSLEIDTEPRSGQPLGPVQRHMVSTGPTTEFGTDPDDPTWGRPDWGAMEYLGMVFHGPTITHLDALCHNSWEGRLFNGAMADDVTVRSGARVNSMAAVPDGIVTRGVLLDVARLRERPWLEIGDGVFPEDLEAAERAQGVVVEEGDAVLLRTGFPASGQDVAAGQPGYHAATLPWLHERGVAVLGADTSQDVVPSGYRNPKMPIHAVGISAMGLWLLDNCDLERLAKTCERFGRWHFQFVLGSLRIQGGTGSPVNPLAIF